MEQWEKKLAEIMELKDPRKAYIEIALLVHREKLSMTVAEDAVDEYIKRYNIDEDDMAFYPDGERVLSPELFWESGPNGTWGRKED